MIKVYSGLKGLTVSLFVIAGVALFISIFIWGIAKAAELLLPFLTVLASLLIAVFLLVILPASFFKDLRRSLADYSMTMSKALGVAAWMMSFFFIVKNLGFWGILFAFLFQLLAPLAIAGAVIKGAWEVAGYLLLWISFAYVMRFYSQWLLVQNGSPQQKGKVIDIETIEVEDSE